MFRLSKLQVCGVKSSFKFKNFILELLQHDVFLLDDLVQLISFPCQRFAPKLGFLQQLVSEFLVEKLVLELIKFFLIGKLLCDLLLYKQSLLLVFVLEVLNFFLHVKIGCFKLIDLHVKTAD